MGNLTLTGYNTEYSDHAFKKKRDMQGGFRESPLKLNDTLRTLENWDESAIKMRAEKLGALAATVWSSPFLSTETLEAYRPNVEKVAGYNINDHPLLVNRSPMHILFKAFRKEVLALDVCVTEEFLKRYVAYKAETNFVDVAPQKERLRLCLNMQFHELHDSKELSRDVTNIGHDGTGDVEIGFSKLDELAYVMGLVRQAFEKQIGTSEAET